MTNKLKTYFEQKVISGQHDDNHAIELASAALLIEMIRMDEEVNESEQRAVFHTLKSQFNLTHIQTEELYQVAESELKNTTDHGRFTDLINQHFSYEEKLKMIVLLWRIAYADKQLHRDEARFVQEISQLLAIKQEDFDICRNQVREEVL